MDFYFSGLWYSLCYARIGVDLLSCWHQWLGKHNSNIWNLIPGCLMWNVWLEQNRHSFENMEKTLDELKVLCKRSLFEWSHCWGFTESSSLPKFLFSLRLTIWFPSLIVHHREQLVLVIFYLLIIVLWLPIKKKKKTCVHDQNTYNMSIHKSKHATNSLEHHKYSWNLLLNLTKKSYWSSSFANIRNCE